MKRLITAQRAIELAFSEGEFLPSESISTATILAVEQQRIKPIVGAELYQKLISGEYASLSTCTRHKAQGLATASRQDWPLRHFRTLRRGFQPCIR